jgi:hypothetical protein
MLFQFFYQFFSHEQNPSDNSFSVQGWLKKYENIKDKLKYYFAKAKCGILGPRIRSQNLCRNAGSAPGPYIINTDHQP